MVGRPRKNFFKNGPEDVLPQAQHTAQLLQKEQARKSNKPGILEERVEMVVSAFNRRKYVKIMRMDNGNVYRVPISKAEFDAKK